MSGYCRGRRSDPQLPECALQRRAYTPDRALRDFAIGIGMELIGDRLGELVAKYGTQAVRAGFKRLGLDEAFESAARSADEAADDVRVRPS